MSSFLIGTLFLSLTAVPWYLYFFGIDWFQIVLFFFMLFACGFSITLGYHRLFSHLTFRAHWLVRLFAVIFGAAAFESSVLWWSSEHRNHHKHVDHDDDLYSISKGLFYAHIGWLMFKLRPKTNLENVADLKKDPLLVWQHRHIHVIAFVAAFVFPTAIAFGSGGWRAALGALSLQAGYGWLFFSTAPSVLIRSVITSVHNRIRLNAAPATRGQWRVSRWEKGTTITTTSFSTTTATG